MAFIYEASRHKYVSGTSMFQAQGYILGKQFPSLIPE